ncbi:PilZ domain-containing protein [Persephonella atlantica]|uniref:PilZ domain-containing protein n=1 Tax=Persephonella atlantica TaxID=2699429 RepID=A0ABS1GFF3_9AQUI|nr:PilZ domain-containing protein [Persephonella atlantica]MBK3331650.1 PilZ domain-containing protein [Persephonella atlantica]
MEELKKIYSSLEKEKSFFEDYRNRFVENFVQVFSSFFELKIPEEKLRKLGSDLYSRLFSLKGDPTKDFYSLSRKMYETKVDIRAILSKVFMLMIKDFLDRLLENNGEIYLLRNFIALIDIYLNCMDRASGDYIESLENKISSAEEKRKKEEQDIIVDYLKIKREEISIIDHFYEVPVTCSAKLIRIENHKAYFDVKKCINKIFEKNHFVFIKIPDVEKTIKALITDINYERGILVLTDFVFSQIPQEKRKFVRVRLSKKIPVIIKKESEEVEGMIDDISVGGIGVYCVKIDHLSVGEIVELLFVIDGYSVKVKGELKYITPLEKFFRIGIQFINLSPKDEEIIGEFVTKRQFEILRKLRQL